MNPVFPFAAIVGQDRLKAALALVAVDPKLGGLLISGPRGSAKSTVARSLADITHQGRFVTLPLGATEDRVVGTLNLDKALGEGEFEFSPGLLARANDGMLYVDEVNLLPDHLVDVLLDAAASGTNHVERDGISHEHDARFVLVGTMNPDEGELRPQLLDRFGLMATVQTNMSIAERQQIVERRLAFDDAPSEFDAHYRHETDTTRQLLQKATEQLGKVTVPASITRTIAERCATANVEGYRADIIMQRAARAYAALQQVTVVRTEHVDFVEDFVLQHRRKPTGSSQPPEQPPSGESSNDPSTTTQASNQGQSDSGSSIQGAYGQQRAQTTDVDAQGWTVVPQSEFVGTQHKIVETLIHAHSRNSGSHQSRRLRASTKDADQDQRVDWLRTLIDRDNVDAWRSNNPRSRLHYQQPVRKQQWLNLVLLDTSASTLAGRGQIKAKGFIEALSARSYLRREHLSVVTFGNDTVTCVVSAQRAPKTLLERLHRIAAGGGTPLNQVIDYATNLINKSRAVRPLCHVYLLTDGRTPSPKALSVFPEKTKVTVVDIESSPVKLKLSEKLADWLHADYWHIDALKYDSPTA